MPFGSGDYQYELVENWAKLPAGWQFGWVAAVACDSQDRVYAYSRSEHPLVVLDRDGNFLASWGEDVIKDAHGIFIDDEDNVWCTERETHCIFKFNPQGELVMTIGVPGQEGGRANLSPAHRPGRGLQWRPVHLRRLRQCARA